MKKHKIRTAESVLKYFASTIGYWIKKHPHIKPKTMKILLSVFFMSISCLVSAQTELMSIKFMPSFTKGSRLSISNSTGGYSVSLIGELVNETVLTQESTIAKIQSFMPEYFIGKQQEDSVERAKQLEDARNGVHMVGLDGITIEGTYKDQNSNQIFQFWSPVKTSVNYKLMTLLFDLMKGLFVKPETAKYLTELLIYFPDIQTKH
jgi:hypothetical protein